MRDLVLQMGISIDGKVSGGPGEDSGGGGPQHPEVVSRTLDWISRAGVHAMGRVTYEEMSSFWPTSTDPYAAPMNERPKVVFSTTLTRADWDTSTIARGELADEFARLKDRRVATSSCTAGTRLPRRSAARTWWTSIGWSRGRWRSGAGSPCSRTCRAGAGSRWSSARRTPTGP